MIETITLCMTMFGLLSVALLTSIALYYSAPPIQLSEAVTRLEHTVQTLVELSQLEHMWRTENRRTP